MAWTGAATTTKRSIGLATITGLSLAAGANGTIGDNGDAGAGVQLPAGMLPLSEYSSVIIEDPTSVGSNNVSFGGSPVRATITNNNAVGTGALVLKVICPVH